MNDDDDDIRKTFYEAWDDLATAIDDTWRTIVQTIEDAVNQLIRFYYKHLRPYVKEIKRRIEYKRFQLWLKLDKAQRRLRQK